MADFLSTLQQFESGGRNIPNTTRGTSSGQAQGFNQITTGTWHEFGGDLYAPTPLQATPEQQNAIAAKIPLKRWAPETLVYLRNHGFALDPNAPLAANIALNHGTLGVTPAPHSTPTEAPGPIDPSILAHGGTSPPIPGTTLNAPAVARGTLPGFSDKEASDKFIKDVQAFTGQSAQSGQDKAAPAAALNFLPARNVSPLIPPAGSGQVSPQTYGTTLAGMGAPLQWGSQAPGHMYGADAGGAPIGQQFGTQLGSMQQLQQMMAMMGNPYGDA